MFAPRRRNGVARTPKPSSTRQSRSSNAGNSCVPSEPSEGRVMTNPQRREFLRFMAASPYVAAFGGVGAFLEDLLSAQQRPIVSDGSGDLIAQPADALSVFDFEEAAHRKVMPGHWAYMKSGVDDDVTLRANRDGYSHVQLRPRRLRD